MVGAARALALGGAVWHYGAARFAESGFHDLLASFDGFEEAE